MCPTFVGRIKHKLVVLFDGRAQRPYQCDEELGCVAIRSTGQQIVGCEGQKPGQQIVLPIRGDREVRGVKGGQLTAQRAGQLDALIRLPRVCRATPAALLGAGAQLVPDRIQVKQAAHMPYREDGAVAQHLLENAGFVRRAHAVACAKHDRERPQRRPDRGRNRVLSRLPR